MNKQDLKNELKKVTILIDKAIIQGKNYKKLAIRHRLLVTLLYEN